VGASWEGLTSLTLPTTGHGGIGRVISAQAYPRPDDADRFTVFLTTADVGCLASGAGADDCSNGVILYQDFDRAGHPAGQPWRELPRHDVAQGCGTEHNLTWESHPASTARWLPDWPQPSQEALFFTGGAWSAAALGLFSQTCLLRVQPGETPDDPFQISRASELSHFPATVRGHKNTSKRRAGRRLRDAIHPLNLGPKSAIIGKTARAEGECQARSARGILSAGWR
jgi:hypothetical protein